MNEPCSTFCWHDHVAHHRGELLITFASNDDSPFVGVVTWYSCAEHLAEISIAISGVAQSGVHVFVPPTVEPTWNAKSRVVSTLYTPTEPNFWSID